MTSVLFQISFTICFLGLTNLIESNKLKTTDQSAVEQLKKINKPPTTNHSTVEQLKFFNDELKKRLITLENLDKSIKFLKLLSNRFLKEINTISNENKLTSLEIHNVPSLTPDEAHRVVENIGKIICGRFEDRELAGIRLFYTKNNLLSRNLIVTFKTFSTKVRWFSRFVQYTKQLGFARLKDFPGINVTLYDGTVMKGLTLQDHLSKHKSAVLKVAQGLLAKFKFIKCYINNSDIYVERKLGPTMFMRYLVREFEDIKLVKEHLLREQVPIIPTLYAREDITPNNKVFLFTKNRKVILIDDDGETNRKDVDDDTEMITHKWTKSTASNKYKFASNSFFRPRAYSFQTA